MLPTGIKEMVVSRVSSTRDLKAVANMSRAWKSVALESKQTCQSTARIEVALPQATLLFDLCRAGQVKSAPGQRTQTC